MNRKIYCRTEEERKAFMEKAYKLMGLDNGLSSWGRDQHCFFFSTEDGASQCFDDYEFFLNHENTYTEVADFLALPEPKREFDIKDRDIVLVRDFNLENWEVNAFRELNMEDNKGYAFITYGDYWKQIAPYEGNEKYLGTCDDIPGSWTAEDLK